MWSYDKRLQFPVNIKNPDPQTAKIVITQLGGPDGELGASMRYLNQRYAMPYKECKAILTDIGTEELAHMEMISAIVYQLTRNLTPEQIKEGGFEAYFVDHTTGIYPQFASGTPRSHDRHLPAVRLGYPVERDDLPVQGRSYHRPVRGYGSRAESPHHL